MEEFNKHYTLKSLIEDLNEIVSKDQKSNGLNFGENMDKNQKQADDKIPLDELIVKYFQHKEDLKRTSYPLFDNSLELQNKTEFLSQKLKELGAAITINKDSIYKL